MTLPSVDYPHFTGGGDRGLNSLSRSSGYKRQSQDLNASCLTPGPMLLVPATLYIKFGTCILGNKGDLCLSIVFSVGLSVPVYTACACVRAYMCTHTGKATYHQII